MKHAADQFELFELSMLPAIPEEREHHPQGPSVMNALDACPGYQSKGGTNQAAEDGERLHDIMQKVCARLVVYIRGGDKPRGLALEALKTTLFEETVSEEEELHLKRCCEELQTWLNRKPIRIETEGRVYTRNPDGSVINFGHFDLRLWMSETVVILFDWKFGWILVPNADDNWQGKNYMVGTFQENPEVERIGVIFVQPKHNKVSRASYTRVDAVSVLAGVRSIVQRAQAPDAMKRLKPNPYCDFCKVAGSCTALLNEASRAVAIHEGLPMPATFTGLQISTPEEAARALYVVDRLQVLIEESGLKQKAKDFARANGGKISCRIGPDKEVVIELKNKRAARSVNSPALIADLLKEWLTPEQVLGCCDPKLGALEEIFAEAMQVKANAEATRILECGEQLATVQTQSEARDEIRKAAKAEAKAKRITKKQAAEILNDALLSEGLITSPEGRVEFLKVRVEKTAAQQLTQ